MKTNFFLCITLTSITLSTFCMVPPEEIIQKSMTISWQSWKQAKRWMSYAIHQKPSAVDTQEWGTGGYTPLCFALEKDDHRFTRFLLEKGTDPNFDIQRVHSSKPIFFAKSVATLSLLKLHGACLTDRNTGTGITRGMNLLHHSINCNNQDEDLFDYVLEQGGDPDESLPFQVTLWHSFMEFGIRECPEDRFFNRARKLQALGISPFQTGDELFTKNAIELLTEKIDHEEKYGTRENCDKLKRFYDFVIKMRDPHEHAQAYPESFYPLSPRTREIIARVLHR